MSLPTSRYIGIVAGGMLWGPVAWAGASPVDSSAAFSLVATPLYTACLVVLALVLSVRVIRLRRGRGVSLGTAGDDELTRAVRAHGNLTEHAPLALLLMAFLELGGGNPWVLHAAGASLVAGRCVHAWSLIGGVGTGRVAGMALTFSSWGILVLATFAAVFG